MVLVFAPTAADLGLAALRPIAAPGGACRAVQVIDGDTLRLWCPDGVTRLRLAAIDTPEIAGRCPSEIARAWVATWAVRRALWSAGEVALVDDGRADRYGRMLGDLRLDGVSLGQRLIASGVARPYDGGRRPWCG